MNSCKDVKTELLILFQALKIMGIDKQNKTPFERGEHSGYNYAANKIESIIRKIK